MFSLVKLSGKWYSLTIDSVEDGMENIQEHIDNGNIVCLTDNIETFADEMGIDEEEITNCDNVD